MDLLLPAFVAIAVWLVWRSRQPARRATHIDAFDFARLLDARLAKRRPDLDLTQRRRVLEGLREWFHVCNRAGRRHVAMPSQVVDDAWHEFILFTRNYQQFCRNALGRFLHHVPAEAMASPTSANVGLRRSWRLACMRAGIDPRAPAALPLLFALDQELDITDGFRYRLDCLAAGNAGVSGFCASHIGCSSCSSGDDGTGDSDGGGDDGCSGASGGD